MAGRACAGRAGPRGNPCRTPAGEVLSRGLCRAQKQCGISLQSPKTLHGLKQKFGISLSEKEIAVVLFQLRCTRLRSFVTELHWAHRTVEPRRKCQMPITEASLPRAQQWGRWRSLGFALLFEGSEIVPLMRKNGGKVWKRGPEGTLLPSSRCGHRGPPATLSLTSVRTRTGRLSKSCLRCTRGIVASGTRAWPARGLIVKPW